MIAQGKRIARTLIAGVFVALGLLHSAPAPASSQEVLPLPKRITNLKGAVYASVVQPDGKVVVGGFFNAINGVARRNLARLNADGSLDDSWNPGCSGAVRALTLQGGTLFVGGEFSAVGNAYRLNLGAIDTATGSVLDFAPNPDSYISKLAASADTLYVGGNFATIGGKTRYGLAAVDIATGTASDWDPQFAAEQYPGGNHGYIGALAVSDHTIYVGGSFLSIGGKSRLNLAEIDTTSGLATDWNPAPSDIVFALSLAGQSIYVGGAFTQIGGVTLAYLARIDRGTAAPVEWYPTPNSYVFTILPAGDLVYIVGAFSSIGEQSHSAVAAVDAQTGLATTWQPDADLNGAASLAISGEAIFVTGNFLTSSGHNSGGIARFSTLDAGIPSMLTAGRDAYVEAIRGQPDGKVVIAGDFTEVDGVDRNHIARLNSDNTLDTDWNPNADSQIVSLEVIDGTVYAGGSFMHIGGQARAGLAALDGQTGAATAWNPSPNPAGAGRMVKLQHTLYVSGIFTMIGGAQRNYLAAFDTSDGTVTAWNPDPNDPPGALAASNEAIYVGGGSGFTHIGGADRARLAALDPATGAATSWNPGVDAGPGNFSFVTALARKDNAVYVGGYFSTIGGAQRSNVAAIDASSGLATEWNPGSVSSVYAIAVHDGYFYLGGAFDNVAGVPRDLLGAIDRNSAAKPGWNVAPWVGSFVTALEVANDHVYAGGLFTVADGEDHEGLVVLQTADKIFHEPFEQSP